MGVWGYVNVVSYHVGIKQKENSLESNIL